MAKQWAGVVERTARIWISGTFTPAREHFVELKRNTDALVLAELSLAGHNEANVLASLEVVIEVSEIMLRQLSRCKSKDR